jgi:hypothetical protein
MGDVPVFPFKRYLIVGLAICAALQLASVRSRRITPAHADVAVSATGSFQPDGQYPGEPFTRAIEVRTWGSWSGSDDNQGTITIGPFPAPRVLRFGVGGYPNNPGNSLRVELLGTENQRAIEPGSVGERWQVMDCLLPADWAGHPIRIVGTDTSTGIGGWLALSEPIGGARGDGNNALIETFAAWAINGLLLGLIYVAALRWLVARDTLAAQWIPLGAGAIVAVCGYAVFWAYFVNALLGVLFSWAVLGIAAFISVFGPRWSPRSPSGWFGVTPRRPKPNGGLALHRNATGTHEVAMVLKLTAVVGIFHLTLLHLFPTSVDFYTLAANRFAQALPGDNILSHVLAERLFDSQLVKNPADEWLSSDRPPLQSGWQLLTWSAGQFLGLDRRVASGTSAVWFQLLWVAAAHGLLRSCGVGRQRAAGWIAVCAVTGFFTQNTVFTWPKLSAAAFACGAFGLLVFRQPESNSRTDIGWAAAFAGLGWLSHGGVAFSFLALAPWLGRQAARGEWRRWRPAMIVLLLLTLPWLAYQKFYDPPANRLFKWHLAGQTTKDERGTWQTIRESYSALPVREIWRNKLSNFHSQIFGEWRNLIDVTSATFAERRHHEFFHTARALTWWPLLGVVALASRRRLLTGDNGALAALGGWIVLTIILWCLLMFGTYQAVIHHGSYALMIGLFVFFSVMLDRAGRGWFAAIVALQSIAFATTWAVGNTIIFGPPTGLAFVVVAAAGLAWFVVQALRDARHENFDGYKKPQKKGAD